MSGDNDMFYGQAAGQTLATASGKDISHIIVCGPVWDDDGPSWEDDV